MRVLRKNAPLEDRAHHVFEDRRQPATDRVPDILYIMGTGRSGTTILEVLLSNDEGIVATGELKHLFRDAYVRDLPCACAKPGRDCDMWSEVLNRSGWSLADCERVGDEIAAVESHARFFRVYFDRVKDAQLASYREATTQLLMAIRRFTHCTAVVDSSKYPSRALLLSKLYPGKVRIVCVTRSAAGLLAAFRKPNPDEQRPKSRLAATLYYLYVLFCMRLVRGRLPDRCMSIRFEELRSDPIAVIRKIERWSGLSFPKARRKLARREFFEVGHIVTGNRLRKQGRVRFEASEGPPRVVRQTLLERMLERYRVLLGF
jgi:hypothetical protein